MDLDSDSDSALDYANGGSGSDSEPPLHLAASDGDVEEIRALLEQKADINEQVVGDTRRLLLSLEKMNGINEHFSNVQ